MGCFGPSKMKFRIAGMELDRCPNWYLCKDNPEDLIWVNRIITLYNWRKEGALDSVGEDLSLADVFGIDITDQEIKRIENKKAKDAMKDVKSK